MSAENDGLIPSSWLVLNLLHIYFLSLAKQPDIQHMYHRLSESGFFIIDRRLNKEM